MELWLYSENATASVAIQSIHRLVLPQNTVSDAVGSPTRNDSGSMPGRDLEHGLRAPSLSLENVTDVQNPFCPKRVLNRFVPFVELYELWNVKSNAENTLWGIDLGLVLAGRGPLAHRGEAEFHRVDYDNGLVSNVSYAGGNCS